MRTLASAAMSLVTFGPGSSTRYICVSPRPRSSSPATSLSCWSAGTSSRNRLTAVSIRLLVSLGEAKIKRARLEARPLKLDLVALEQLAPDHHPLDLASALADQQQRRVAVEALDLVLLRVAVAAVDPQALLDAEAARL